MNYKISLYTIVRKEVDRVIRIWPQTIIPPVISMMLYLIIFGSIIGRKVGNIHGFPYMLYILPGLVMNVVIANSYTNTAHSFFLTKFNHSIEEMLVAPMPAWLIVMGYTIGSIFRGLVVGGLVIFVATFFVEIKLIYPGFTLTVFILASIIFSSLGFINGLLARSFDEASWISSLVITPLSYFGGIFYSIESLPQTWQHISLCNPIFYIVNAFRFGMLNYSDVNPYISLLYMTIFAIVFSLTACFMMVRGIGVRQ
jgi:ABC-2 type transport system permease protein